MKSLADQTAKATEEISTQIQAIRNDTREAVSAIAQIIKTIESVGTTQISISGSVEQQGAATKEISRSAIEASAGANQVSENISDVAKAAETGPNSLGT